MITELLQERYPGADARFGVDEALGVLAFLAQNQSVAHEVASALTGSGTRPANREQRRAERPPRKRATTGSRRRSASS